MDYCSNFNIITLKNLDKNMENRPSIQKTPPPPKKKCLKVLIYAPQLARPKHVLAALLCVLNSLFIIN